ncbi:SIFV.gp58-like protein [Sulfolobus islandicus filamentous virus 2]|uniref:SIFV.gp58-like protein n=1 Tax=Sulfolobus islandicus filamentous virus 2 TaxID=1902331 RepID=A0A1D8BJB0_SIFV|nr:SIFV.gp58-like protein [Sulfolobus islandicus filamentous virus 2]
MSSNLAYLAYEAMTSGLSSVSFYVVDTSNNNHSLRVLVPSENTYYYFDSSQSSYTATSFNISVNGNVILTVSLNNLQKTGNMTLIVVVTLSIGTSLPGNLGTYVIQAIQALFAGVLINLGCSATAYYTIVNQQTGSSSTGSIGLSFSLSNNSQFVASGSISYSQYAVVYVTQIIISCSTINVKENIITNQLTSSECTSSSGCTYTITITFTS